MVKKINEKRKEKPGKVAKYEGKTKEQIIAAEKRKLGGIYKKLDEKTKKATENLVEEAAFMGASLHELRQKIAEKGYTEEYQNGANQKGVKKSAEVEIYNTMIKNYMAVIKQLTDLVPKEQVATKTNDGFEDFVNGRMIRYPEEYNPILEYWEKIQNKEIIVSNKVYRTYKKVVYDIQNPGEYYYSPKRANHVIEFAENYCRHSKGKFGGKRVLLELWEKAYLATVFGFIDIEGNRKYRESILIVGKKNGKSLLASVVGLYMLTADGEMGPEVYAVATKKDQSKIIWLESKRMVKKSPSLLRRVKPLVAELTTEFNDGVFKPLASDSDTLDGLNIHCVLMDEIHQWKQGKALYDIMADGITAREQPLISITSTAGTIREDIYDQKYEEAENVINGYFDPDGYKDEHLIAFIYELDNRKEWTQEECWMKANPGLGTIKNAKTLKDKVEKAKKNPIMVKNLLCKEFNIRETSSEAWLTFEQANNPEKYDLEVLKPRYGIGGVDLSSTTDLTAAKYCLKFLNDEHI